MCEPPEGASLRYQRTEDGDLRLDLLYADEPVEAVEEDGDVDDEETSEDAVKQLSEEE